MSVKVVMTAWRQDLQPGHERKAEKGFYTSVFQWFWGGKTCYLITDFCLLNGDRRRNREENVEKDADLPFISPGSSAVPSSIPSST